MKYFNLFLLILIPQFLYAETWNIISKDFIATKTKYVDQNPFAYQPLGAQYIKALPNGNIYFTTTSSFAGEFDSISYSYKSHYYVCYFDKENKNITNLSLNDSYGISLSTNFVCLELDNAGNLLVATRGPWLLKWDGKQWTKYMIDDEFGENRKIMRMKFFDNKCFLLARSFIVDTIINGMTHIGETWFDILVFDNDKLSLVNHIQLPDWREMFSDFWIDADGSMWFCGEDKIFGGLWKLDQDSILTEYNIYQGGQYNETYISARFIIGDDNYIYVGMKKSKMIGDYNYWHSTIPVFDKKTGSLIKIIDFPRYQSRVEEISEILNINGSPYILNSYVGLGIINNLELELIQFPPDFENNFLDTIGNETEHPLISDMWRIMNDFDYSGNVLYIASQAGILYREYDPSDINISKDMSMALDIYPNILVYGMQEITITSWIGVDINTIQIMDITGSIIYQDDGPIGYTEGIRLYSIPNLSSGKYFILFNTDKGNFISPIILIN